ncbi:hypothetical protein [Mucilaginibacter sp. OK283]|jgi:uncharacterized protein involved in exopolysaccharide biosynthesis|uniref:hypothetical protein n=1 Tax=Mucilaginibacter sp. OK283 TaxID=1881049 RepID=UPI0008BB81A4|nr:hypothetical protein [Mucilaginibacter sp. OK283]SEO12020.1 hypothetical protein SAMN05428947_101375 [Mucilaginibacter sp. OK283]
MEKKNTSETNELTLKDITFKVKAALRYLKTKLLILTIIAVIGAIAGYAFAFTKKTIYTAQLTFVLEDASKGGIGSQYSALASLAGINLDNNNGGLFDPTNILALYKTRLMIEKALLRNVIINNKKQLLIERYIDVNKLRQHWKEKDHINYIDFNGDPNKFSRKQDSIITNLVYIFNQKNLMVNKLEKDLSIIEVEFTSNDELFAQAFTNVLVETVNDFYVQTKTKKTTQNLDILQKQADSVKKVLNSALSGVASATDATPNANPGLLSLHVPSQKRQVDVQSSSAVYSEIVKNLEVSKISLRNEMPLIQVIDRPVLPLSKKNINKIFSTIAGFFLFFTAAAFFFLIKRTLIKSLS